MISPRNRFRNSAWLSGSAVLLLSMLGAGMPVSAALADLPNASNSAAKPADPQVAKLLTDADAALKSGNLNLALIQLKNAVRLAPQDGNARMQLGLALLRGGDAVGAEQALRQARGDGAPEDIVVPSILQVMLIRGEFKQLLAEFTEPPQPAIVKAAPDIFRGRAFALQSLGEPQQAKAAMDRALSLRHDGAQVLAAAQLARQQDDLPAANKYADEAVKLDPNSLEAAMVKIQLLRQTKESEKALAMTEDVIKRFPQSFPLKIARVEILLDLKQDAKATQEIDAILLKTPKMAIANYYKAVLMARANDLKGAWGVAQSLSTDFVQAQPGIAMMVAQIAVSSGNLESGGSILTALLQKHADLNQARLQLAALRMRQGNSSAALEVLTPIKGSPDPQVQAILSQAYLGLGRTTEAIASLEKATASSSGPQTDVLKRQLALSQMRAGNNDKAIEELQDLVKREPENIEMSAALIAALTDSRKFDQALSVADALGKAVKQSAYPAFYRGQILALKGDLAGAEKAYEQALVVDPKFVPALYYRGTGAISRADWDVATKNFQQIVALDPKNVPAYLKLAEIAINNDQEAQGITLLNQATRANPDNPAPRLALANYQLSQKKYQDAQATVSELLQKNPKDDQALTVLGQIQFNKGEKGQAVSTFRALATANPKSSAAQIMLAEALSGNGDRLGAETAARKAMDLAPESPQPYSLLITQQIAEGKATDALVTARSFGNNHPGPDADLLMADTNFRLNHKDEAVGILTKGLAAKPDRRYVARLAQFAISSGDSKKATTLYADWIGKNSEDVAMRRDYASLLLSAGDKAAARREFETVLKQAPQDVVALNNLGWILQKDDPARALSMVTQAARIAPRSAQVTDTLGWMKLQRQDRQGALPLLQRAHDLDVQNPEIGYHLAVALDANGKRAEAKTLLLSVLQANPKFDGVDDAKQLVARW